MENNKILRNITDEKYFSDTSFMNKSSIMKLSKSIRNFTRASEPLATDALRFGSLLDTYLTDNENFKLRYVRKFEGDRRTKAGKEAYKEYQAENAGKIEVSVKDIELLVECASSLKANKDTRKYFKPENGYEYQVVGTADLEFLDKSLVIPFKVKADIFKEHKDHIEIIDLKTIKDLKSVKSNVISYSYHIQQYLYSRVFRKVTGKKVDFKFVFVEKAFPNDSVLVELSPDWILVAHKYLEEVIMPRYKKVLSITAPESEYYPESYILEAPEYLL